MKNKLFHFAVLLLTGCLASQLYAQENELTKRFGRTCFTLDVGKRAEAERLMQEYFKKNSDPADVFRRLKALSAAAVIGHPDAILIKCRFGDDKLAPRRMIEDGQAWCALGLERIPELLEKLEPRYIAELKSEETRSGLRYDVDRVKAEFCKIDGIHPD